MLYTLTLLAALPGAGGWGSGGCGPGGCVVPAAVAAQEDTSPYWRKIGDNELGLYSGTTQIGHYSFAKQEYRSVNAAKRTLGAVEYKTPIPLPDGWAEVSVGAGVLIGDEPWRTNGVDLSHVPKEPKYVKNGAAVPREAAIESFGKSDLPDDAAKLRLTIIDPDAKAKREQVIGALGDMKNSFHVKGYTPDSPMLAGFVADPGTVYIQTADGKVVHRGQFVSTEHTVGAARKARDNYNPKADVDLTAPALPNLAPLLDFAKQHMLTLIVIGVVLFLIFKK